MGDGFNPEHAIARLRAVFQEDGTPSQYIAAFLTSAGRAIAVERQREQVQLWLESAPPPLDGVAIKREYAAGESRNSNLNAGRGARLATGHPAVLVTVLSELALDGLIAWYGHSASVPQQNDVCLLGTPTNKTAAWFQGVAATIDEQGAWASWWSFRIKEEARPLLKMPFWIYLNGGGDSFVARALVEGMVSGADGQSSPWPEVTDPHLRGKTNDGPGASKEFKTWLKFGRFEMLPVPLSRKNFEPVENVSTHTSLLNQKTFGYARLKTSDTQHSAYEGSTMTQGTDVSLNTILYGPPGTSKTFRAIDHALRIIDPAFASNHANDRKTLKARFDALVAEGRIEFVTFHQSYSYEDFVQGIRASSNEGAISYQVEDGVFKRICLRAMAAGADDAFRMAFDEFKESIADEPVELKTKTGKTFSVTWLNGKTLRLRPHSGKEDADYAVSIDNIERAYRGEDEKSMYNYSYVRAVLAHVKQAYNVPDYAPGLAKKPYVLIIDEINRGNIASIFGELITLLEPSKRHGRDEALQATLAYTTEGGAAFTVPDNLYLIGTMNTADRSLARVDTALRRRFEFVPMYPVPSELDDVEVEGVNLGKLLRTMNERIEVLYDRDHLLGHAYFMHMKQNPAKRTIAQLAEVFRNKILPLLEEYFFEDWQKIRLVLGDNQKSDKQLQFVIEDETSASALFGSEPVVQEVKRYRRCDDRSANNSLGQTEDTAFDRSESYRQVYAPI
jgi:hypothetical protein